MNDERLETIAQRLADGVYRIDSVSVADAMLASWSMSEVIDQFQALYSGGPDEAALDASGADSSL